MRLELTVLFDDRLFLDTARSIAYREGLSLPAWVRGLVNAAVAASLAAPAARLLAPCILCERPRRAANQRYCKVCHAKRAKEQRARKAEEVRRLRALAEESLSRTQALITAPEPPPNAAQRQQRVTWNIRANITK